MRISYSNYPILKKLNSKDFGEIITSANDTEGFKTIEIEFRKLWYENVDKFSKNINIISKPFHEAVLKAEKKLAEIITTDLENSSLNIELSGIFIFDNYVLMIDYSQKSNSQPNIVCFIFSKNGTPFVILNQFYNVSEMTTILWMTRNSNNISTKEDQYKKISNHVSMALLYDFFKRYAQVETKELKPHTKLKEINCKYVNDTLSNITYLDSKWFTNLVKSDAFKVSGHFRLQPKKVDGVWTRELIWINEFMKHGYTSKARIYDYTQKAESN